MTKEEIIRGFKALPQEEKGAVVQEIAREFFREQGGSFAVMMSMCSGMMGGMSPFPFATSERAGEPA